MDCNSLKIIDKFNDLLDECYDGSLKSFCLEFDIKNRGESFYKKVQKSRLRMIKNNVSKETLDEFRKYIVFMESKLLEKECSWNEKKALKEFKSLIKLDI